MSDSLLRQILISNNMPLQFYNDIFPLISINKFITSPPRLRSTFNACEQKYLMSNNFYIILNFLFS